MFPAPRAPALPGCALPRLRLNTAFGEAPIAQLDRVLPSEGKGQRFESSWVRHKNQGLTSTARFSKKYVEARWKHRPRKQTSASSNALPITHSETCSALERQGKAAGYPSEVCGLQRQLRRALSDRSTFDRRPLSGSNLAETSRSPVLCIRQFIADCGRSRAA